MCCTPASVPMPDLPEPPPPADYSDAYALTAKGMEYGTGIMERQTKIAEKQAALAEQAFGFWKNTVAPLQKGVIADTKRGLPTGPYEGRARNAVIQQAGKQQKATEASLAMRGVDPSSPMAVSARQDVSTRTGATAGMTQHGAARRVEELNRNRKIQTYGLGANIPAQTVQGYGTAAGIMGRAAQPVMASYNTIANAHMAQANAESQLANQMWSLQTQSIMADYNRDVQQAQAEAGMWNSLFQTGTTLAAAKIIGSCLPAGALVDTPDGYMDVASIRVGDQVVGMDGNPCVVLQVHQYLEPPDEQKYVPFIAVTTSNGGGVWACVKHIVDGKPLGVFAVGDAIGPHTVSAVAALAGVRVSYDLVTSGPDSGYRMAGVPVASMAELLFRQAKEA